MTNKCELCIDFDKDIVTYTMGCKVTIKVFPFAYYDQ